MKSIKCRCCGKTIKSNSFLEYHNMPGKAQFFPDAKEVDTDKCVDLYIYVCDNCGLIQLSNDPVAYYKDVIRATAVSEEMKEFRIEQFRKFLADYDLIGKKIVEIGAGNGEFMSFMDSAGADVYGVEHSHTSVKKAKDSGFMIEEGYPEGEDFSLENAPFDAFYIMNFLEHIPNPNDFLQSVSNVLSDGAIGLIEVPNTDLIIEKMMFSEFMLDHLCYYTTDSLRLLLEINGFDVIECRSVWHDYCLCAIVKKRSYGSLEKFYTKQDRIIGEVKEFATSRIKQRKKVAVWGAGHQALAILSLSEIGDMIEFVIDSAEFKQNRYTPGSHCLVVSPDVLNNKTVDSVLVMAASYTDEVCGILKEKHSDIEVVAFREFGLEYM